MEGNSLCYLVLQRPKNSFEAGLLMEKQSFRNTPALLTLGAVDFQEKKLLECLVNAVVSILRRPLDYYTMELSEHAEGLSDL